MSQDLEKVIWTLENELQQPEVRKSVERLNDLISDSLVEFGSTGEVFGKKDVLVNLPASPEIRFKMTDFSINILSSDLIQSLYRTEKINAQNGKTTYSLRSSIWRKGSDNKWQMIFHQGTPENKI